MIFPGGKTYFDYHLSAKYGTHPYVIHGTFQRYNNPGKKSRFREAGALSPLHAFPWRAATPDATRMKSQSVTSRAARAGQQCWRRPLVRSC